MSKDFRNKSIACTQHECYTQTTAQTVTRSHGM